MHIFYANQVNDGHLGETQREVIRTLRTLAPMGSVGL